MSVATWAAPAVGKRTTDNFSWRTFFSAVLQPLMAISSRPYFSSLLIRMSCWTVSKASVKSRYITSPTSVLSTRPVTLSKKEMRLVWHNLFMTNSFWLFFITLLLSRCLCVILTSLWRIKWGPNWIWQLEKGTPRELMTSPMPGLLQPCQASSVYIKHTLCFKPNKQTQTLSMLGPFCRQPL